MDDNDLKKYVKGITYFERGTYLNLCHSMLSPDSASFVDRYTQHFWEVVSKSKAWMGFIFRKKNCQEGYLFGMGHY
jgi:hypothetical protein